MGLELESPARLLQQCGLGGMGQAISSAAPVVSSSADHLDEPSGIRRQLALSSAELPATAAGQSPRIRKAPIRPGQSSGLPASPDANPKSGWLSAKSVTAKTESESPKAESKSVKSGQAPGNVIGRSPSSPVSFEAKSSGRRRSANAVEADAFAETSSEARAETGPEARSRTRSGNQMSHASVS